MPDQGDSTTRILLADQTTIITVHTVCEPWGPDNCREMHQRSVQAVLDAFPGSTVIPD